MTVTLLKPDVPYHDIDIAQGWVPVPGGALGVEQKLLSGALDEAGKRGVRTRLIRFQPGTIAPDTFLHDYWEEVYLMEGTLIMGCDPDGTGGARHSAPGYACRPPGTPHGPFASPDGCVFFEIQYYV
ncbi:cupin domain-containing protein [Tropicimonas sp. S265A]|uniref:cupin domain-containing protein n=1 Tax=Tropicimonas sp. S265A TaxID=3415134 RepID=UPI003C7C329B